MQPSQPSVFARDHTIFGVCEALGEDFGFNATWLRVPFAVLLLVNPALVIGTYLALGAIVFVTRWVAPNPRAAAAEPAGELAGDVAHNDDASTRELAVAA